MLHGRHALVTGSTSGIGWAIAQALAKQGCRVVLHGSRAEDDGVRQKVNTIWQISSDFSKVTTGYVQADLQNPEECKALITKAADALGGTIDILVNNAGVQHVSPIDEFPPEKWDMVLSVNLSAPFHTSQAVLPQMYQRNFGRLVHVASVLGTIGAVNKGAYCAAKHGLVGLSKVIALEGAKMGVTSNVICPGWVLTPLVEKQVAALAEKEGVPMEEAKRRILRGQPNQEFISPDSIGDMVVLMCNSPGITGATYVIDGGISTQ